MPQHPPNDALVAIVEKETSSSDKVKNKWSGKWGLSGLPRLANSCTWRFLSSHASSSLSALPSFQCLATCQKPEKTTLKFNILKLFSENKSSMLSVSQYVTTTTWTQRNVCPWLLKLYFFSIQVPIKKHKYIHMHNFMQMNKYMHIYNYIHFMHKFIPIDA